MLVFASLRAVPELHPLTATKTKTKKGKKKNQLQVLQDRAGMYIHVPVLHWLTTLAHRDQARKTY
jgi:hypothetical protein